MLNKSGELEVFVNVVEQGSFSKAANRLGMTQPAVSKLIARIEKRLDVRLLIRSTRHLHLTPEGQIFYERAKQVLADICEMEKCIKQDEEPRGHIKLSTSTSYSEHILEPILGTFLDNYPKVTVDLSLSDNVINLMSEHTDIAIRSGPLENSRLKAKGLGQSPIITVASPRYLQKYGDPTFSTDLEAHSFIAFSYPRQTHEWPESNHSNDPIPHRSRTIQASDGASIRRLALRGLGLARVTEFTVRKDISEGRLVHIVNHASPVEAESFYAVYIGLGGPAPSRVRVLLDYLGQFGRVS
jgi:DNA-binding transcriptional LysR family regulator